MYVYNQMWHNYLRRVKEGMNIQHTIQRRRANWISHILCRNYLLKYVMERKIERRVEVTERRGRRHKRLLYDL
jgi:hypothetical protein